jgi:heme/copper-type cytochrome/quinol oxidase subunit 4
LGEWDETEEGHCYITTGLSAPASTHPEADKAYVGVSATYLIVALLMAVVGSATLVRTVLILALLQFPLHLYMMITLRVNNSTRLDGTESESDWRFGQTVAVLLLGMTIREIISGFQEWRKFEKNINKKELPIDDVETGLKVQDEKISHEPQPDKDAIDGEEPKAPEPKAAESKAVDANDELAKP